jgi:hypothetical protein
MYAMGQRVAKTLDGSRPGYRGSDYGDEARGTGAYGGDKDSSKSSDTTETTRHNPHTDSGYSKTSTVTGDEMKSAARDFVQTLNTNNAIRAAKTGTKFSPFDNFTPTFAPTEKPGFGILDLGLMLATGGLFGTKAKTAAQLIGTAKRTKNLVSDLSNTFGFENPIANMFSGNKTSKTKSTTKNNITNNGGDGEGLASLENQASGYDEYILLLQKLQSGNISDAEKDRYNVLKNMLGI